MDELFSADERSLLRTGLINFFGRDYWKKSFLVVLLVVGVLALAAYFWVATHFGKTADLIISCLLVGVGIENLKNRFIEIGRSFSVELNERNEK